MSESETKSEERKGREKCRMLALERDSNAAVRQRREAGSVITSATVAVSHYKAKKYGMGVVGYERRKDQPGIASNCRVTERLCSRNVEVTARGP